MWKTELGKSFVRKEGKEKVTGQVRYGGDIEIPGLLHAATKTSPNAFARILEIDTSEAEQMPGVKIVFTGQDYDQNVGLYLSDKAIIARNVVRHYGEIVAVVVADTYKQALNAVEKIKVSYDVMTPVMSPSDALKPDAPLLHENMEAYSHIAPIHPEPGSNVANRTKVRKGDVGKAFSKADHVVDVTVEIPPGDHVAMEPRVAIAEIKKSGYVHITSSTQAPFVVKNLMSHFFDVDPGKIIVDVPMVGGGFGGKAGLQLEGLAYLLSKKAGGRPVRVVNTREDDLLASPGHIGLESHVKIAADAKGKILGMDLVFNFNSGAYADYAVNVSRAAAISCTGPYSVENVKCDSLCVYTNMPFATAYRGFGHIEMSFGIERAMDTLADQIGLDPVELRKINAIKAFDTTPVQSVLNASTGDIETCFTRVSEMLGGNLGEVEHVDAQHIKAKGIAGLWKAPAMPTNTDAGAILTFNSDGSCNLNVGVVEIGQGTKTGLAQLVSERLKLPMEKVHVVMPVNTSTSPSDWATAASRGLMMAGVAALEACDDAISQIKTIAASVLKAPERDLVYEAGQIFVSDDPTLSVSFAEVVLGYVYPNGNAVYGQVIGKGRYIAKHLTDVDQETGKGHPDLEWTLGAEGVEVLLNVNTGRYKITKAVCCMDVGKVVNPELARGQVVGGMAMGIGYTIMEGFKFNTRGQVTNGVLRDYKIMRYDDAPEYSVEFLETPQQDGPYGARGLGEQSVIGMPGAISNALSRAAKVSLNTIPMTPELIWKQMQKGGTK
ncbi:xanthine dehydrogenase family protein molybdopterin-binding subunit [Fusibacter tunisiensis]|uniref:CO/xanthine dehydrogenase Mo-binding subunit n=1 Tax=Fusibacter tunisiensis TaxID=1008308 RepID=A0ABS2MQP9_9FIRM|nr:xanthine dehydrogenase family protein molybdopterin-binding subunit [Fusibacter tunisiensis]MBM7561702.1 CO/xanthine dehydrogenase Mo-binding subunit [Fusibacter tunisiensis]